MSAVINSVGKTLPRTSQPALDKAIKVSERIGKVVTDLKAGRITKPEADTAINAAQAELDAIIATLGMVNGDVPS